MSSYAEKLKDPRWQKKRLLTLERDNWTCRHCFDSTSTLHVHHISYTKEPWDAKDEHLVTLCDYCHELEEQRLSEYTKDLVKNLRECGFTSVGFHHLLKIFQEKDRGWTYEEPSFGLLKEVVKDDTLWDLVQEYLFKKAYK